MWRGECIRIGLVANNCWITSGGAEIVDVMKDLDHKAAMMAKNGLPHHLETFVFVAMYTNIPVKCLKRIVGELLDLVFTYQEAKDGSKSMYIKYGFKKNEKEPKINKIHWSFNPPVNANGTTNNKREFNVGQAKLCEWINFVLDEGFVQFGGAIYKQSSGIFMGPAPAPDLANDFAFMHELNFLKVMINRYLLDTRNNIEPLYPLEFIEQYVR